ncbi:MAG: O-antigen ligase family protein, partial [Desulfatibacillaceae bacterium]|nr:O-antigen ligase family protein [Desulfatibacillaceae bacterium]
PIFRIFRLNLAAPWLIWFAVVVVSLAVNGPGSKGWAHDIVLFRFVLFGLALMDVNTRLPVGRHLVWGLAVALGVGAINTLAALGLGHDLLGRSAARYTGKLDQALNISGIAAYSTPFFCVWAALDKKLSPKVRLLLFALAALGAAQLLQIQSRTAIVAAFCGVAFGLIYGHLAGRRSLAGWMVLAGFLVAGVAATLIWNLHNLISVYDRIWIWRVSLAMFYENPVLGTGVSAFRDVFTQVASSGAVEPYIAPGGRVFAGVEQTHAHNLALMLLASTGIAGLGAFAWLFVRACKLVFASPKGWRLGLVSWPAVLLVAGLTGYNIYYSWYQALVAFFLTLAGTANTLLPQNERQKEKKDGQDK